MKSSKSGQIMKISSTSGNHTNSMDDKQDSIPNCKIMISFCDIFQEKQMQE